MRCQQGEDTVCHGVNRAWIRCGWVRQGCEYVMDTMRIWCETDLLSSLRELRGQLQLLLPRRREHGLELLQESAGPA